MSRKLIKDVSASTLQVVVNQGLGIIVFLITSRLLAKDDYGELNWSFAIFTFTNTLLSLRLEHIVVKRSATERDSSKILTLYLFHVLISGVGFYLLLVLFDFIFPAFFNKHNLLLIVGISQLFSFLSSPFKQIANGKERFDYLAIMASVSNLIRVVLLVILIFFESFDIWNVLVIFIISSFIELSLSFFLVAFKMKIPLTTGISLNDYKSLLTESLPQIGVAFLAAGIARIDWILLGLFSTPEAIAEYSFAYRVYEISPLPLLIIAPILLARFSRFYANNPDRSVNDKKTELSMLVRAEMIAATFIPLLLNVIWTPAIDSLTADKYGAVNWYIFLILSFCIPFGYIINILWSALFAQDRLKLILKITAITFCIILIGDLIFIPIWGGLGAAFVFLVATVVEYINFMRFSELSKIKETWQSLFICIAIAVCSGMVSIYFFDTLVMRLATAVILFLLLLLATRQLRKGDIVFMFSFIKRGNINF